MCTLTTNVQERPISADVNWLQAVPPFAIYRVFSVDRIVEIPHGRTCRSCEFGHRPLNILRSATRDVSKRRHWRGWTFADAEPGVTL